MIEVNCHLSMVGRFEHLQDTTGASFNQKVAGLSSTLELPVVRGSELVWPGFLGGVVEALGLGSFH